MVKMGVPEVLGKMTEKSIDINVYRNGGKLKTILGMLGIKTYVPVTVPSYSLKQTSYHK